MSSPPETSIQPETSQPEPSQPEPSQPEPVTRRSPHVSSVPAGVRAASEWAWRSLVIAAAVAALLYLLSYISEAVIPVIVATLLAALLSPINGWLRQRLRRPGLAAGLTVLGTFLGIGLLLFLVGSQITGGFAELSTKVGAGIEQVRGWLRDTFRISDTQLAGWLDQARTAVTSSDGLRGSLAKAGTGAVHVIAGFFISLFALFFFLYEGERIWSWVVRLFPRRSQARVASSGLVAWSQLTAFTRATILVALVDAVGIALVAAVLRVPFPLAIGALVFLGAFIPIVGALLSGMVAVLVALVDQGPVTALLMLAGVIAVQQLESHVLQPFLLGRAVSVHPLAVILAIAAGVVLAGIVGALIAVPVAAVLNAVVKHVAGTSPQPGAFRDGLPPLPDEPEATALHGPDMPAAGAADATS